MAERDANHAVHDVSANGIADDPHRHPVEILLEAMAFGTRAAARVMGKRSPQSYVPDPAATARSDARYAECEQRHDHVGQGADDEMRGLKRTRREAVAR